ncbi:hypothetical protein PROFUN_10886 [Planoprotostelium fungivorum]|uniref:Uncharacterized protein n=1 Tax=Planoprotostelium fungivorum TaxID=1890364 RepID=A0A2P6NC29_9EUKA|nr:hypothetical protein PROFUN_10886 [Planoprotostelium fungivorum]
MTQEWCNVALVCCIECPAICLLARDDLSCDQTQLGLVHGSGQPIEGDSIVLHGNQPVLASSPEAQPVSISSPKCLRRLIELTLGKLPNNGAREHKTVGRWKGIGEGRPATRFQMLKTLDSNGA